MFNIDNNVSATSSTKNLLVGNKIHNVIFKGAQAVDLKDGEFKVIQLTFANDEGEYIDTIFEPTPDAYERKDNSFGSQNPSGVEELLAKVRHAIAALNPELDKAIESGSKSLSAPSWDQLRKLVVASLKKGEGKETQIKLLNFISDNKVRARFPNYILSINSKTNSVYMRTNFIGDNLAFTPKETEKILTQATAAPTNMSAPKDTYSLSDKDNDNDAPTGGDFDFDLESL